MLNVKVRDRSNYSIVFMPHNEPVKVAAELMLVKSIGSVIVLEDGAPVGIVTQRDLLRAFYKDESVKPTDPINRVMSGPICTIDQNESVQTALQKMLINGYRRLGVVDGSGKLIGLCSLTDILQDISVNQGMLSATSTNFQETGQIDLAQKINHELTKFVEEFNLPANTRLDDQFIPYYQFKELLTRLKHVTKPKEYSISEEPIIFMITNRDGLNLYSKNLSAHPNNVQLISALFQAINNLMHEIVVEKGFIDRIQYLDYTIAIKLSGLYLFCYMFKGDSYRGIETLETLSTQFLADPILFDYLSENRNIITGSIENRFEHYIRTHINFRDIPPATSSPKKLTAKVQMPLESNSYLRIKK